MSELGEQLRNTLQQVADDIGLDRIVTAKERLAAAGDMAMRLDASHDDGWAQAHDANQKMDEMKTFGREVEAKLKRSE